MKISFKKIWYWICFVIGTLLLGSALIELIFIRAINSQIIISGFLGAIIILSISKKLNFKKPEKEEK